MAIFAAESFSSTYRRCKSSLVGGQASFGRAACCWADNFSLTSEGLLCTTADGDPTSGLAEKSEGSTGGAGVVLEGTEAAIPAGARDDRKPRARRLEEGNGGDVTQFL